jgi:ATP-dependent helicase HrpB
VFLPGRREIEKIQRELASDLLETGSEPGRGIEVLPLYGDLSSEAQDRVLQPGQTPARRVILATDIAETSLTIPGVRVVIDAGLARKPDFDPNTGLTRLQTVRIAQDSAAQRAGRAGRTAPGVCYRAWSETEQRRLAARTPAEILQADLAPLALELARWGVVDPSSLAWLDPPPAAHWSQALALLEQLEAIDDKGLLTAQGRQMAELPVHPRLASLLVRAGQSGQYSLACDLAALLSERDPLLTGEGDRFGVDLGARVEALQDWRAGSVPSGFDRSRLRRIERIARQLSDLGESSGSVASSGGTADRMSAGGLISLAYPDRIAKASTTSGRFTMVGGRQVKLPDADRLANADWLVVPRLDGGRREARAWLAVSFDLDELMDLHGRRIQASTRTDWHPQSGAVRVRHERRLEQLVLDTAYGSEADPQAVLELLIDEIERQGLDLLNWTTAARRLQARSEQYRRLLDSSDWPDLSEAWLQGNLRQWLVPWLSGVDSLRGVRGIDLVAVFNGLLGWQRTQQLDQFMPLRFTTPAGTQREIEYRMSDPPVLAVRMQEMFGLSETPRVADGRLSLVVHLLSPANRILQITQDLGHFWSDGYREVRKEMRSRYPKHYWPEDPSTAEATSRVKRYL